MCRYVQWAPDEHLAQTTKLYALSLILFFCAENKKRFQKSKCPLAISMFLTVFVRRKDIVE